MQFLHSQKPLLSLTARAAAYGLAVTVLLFLLELSAYAEVQRFRLNPEESHIVTKIKDPFGYFVSGTLRLREGQAGGDPDRLKETATANLLLDATSYDSDLGLRDKDVQEDYLEAQRYRTIRFSSSAVVQVDRSGPSGEGWTLLLRGTLAFHGIEKEITVPIRLRYESRRFVAQGRLQILLEDFKIDVPSLLFLKAGNRVDVEFSIVGER